MSETTMPTGEIEKESVVIERAVEADAEAVSSVLARTWLDTYPNEEAGISLEDVRLRVEGKDGERIPKNIERWRDSIESDDGKRAVYVARLEGDVVGVGAPGILDGQRRIGALYVLPEAQGHGIGGKLMQKALEWHGTDEDIYLAVASYNDTAINFYKRFGFEPTDRPIVDEGNVYGNTKIPEIEMVLRGKENTPVTNNNETTLQSYNQHIQEYIDGTPQEVGGGVKAWIDTSLKGLSNDAKILEIGSAFGRDASYIEGLGFTVNRTDATLGFVDYLRNQGYDANSLNAITDDIVGDYNMVFADAVLLHFTRAETGLVVRKVFESLIPNGRFAFSLKQGEGEEWSDAKLGAPRFFCYWDEQSITKLLSDVGFMSIDIGGFESDSGQGVKWLHIIAHKQNG